MTVSKIRSYTPSPKLTGSRAVQALIRELEITLLAKDLYLTTDLVMGTLYFAYRFNGKSLDAQQFSLMVDTDRQLNSLAGITLPELYKMACQRVGRKAV